MEITRLDNTLLYENDGHYFFYDSSTGVISETNCLFNELINNLCKGDKIKEIIKKLDSVHDISKINIAMKEIEELQKNGIIFNTNKEPVIRCADISEKEWDRGNVLENLILNISHECNMECKYCFADHGHFNSNASFMSKEVAKKSIDYWFEHLDKSRKQTNITFFGGEPLLNKEILKYSLEYIEYLLKGTGVSPKYAITTNGTLIDDELIQLFLKYKIQPDISIDGGEFIQNKNRPLRRGIGSYNKVEESVEKLKHYYNRLVAKITLIHEDVDKLEQSVLDFHITPEGNIYKCSKMVGMKQFCMGDIYSGVQWKNFISKPKSYLMENHECRSCWAKRICGGGCAYANLIYNRDFDVANNLTCEEKKVQIEAAVYLYTKLYLNNKKIFSELYNRPMKGPCIK